MSKFTKLLSIVIVPALGALVLAGAAAPASAAPLTAAPARVDAVDAPTARNEAEWNIIKQAISVAPDGQVQLDGAKAIALGADREATEQVALGLEATGGIATGVEIDPEALTSLRGVVAEGQARCTGHNDWSTQWFGLQVRVNSCNASTLVHAMAAGAGVMALIGMITSWTGVGGLTAEMMAGLIALGATIVDGCASSGRGLILDLAWVGVPWCAGQ